jgi:APA family basic amino acid/polyamine antiporter
VFAAFTPAAAALTRVIVAVVLAALAVAVAAALLGGRPDWSALGGLGTSSGGWYGVLQSAGLLFFAFAGYARIATMGEEVRAPQRTIPRAIQVALGLAVLVYAAMAVALLAVLGPAGVAGTATPVAAAVQAGSWQWATPVVRVGAAAAALGALLALIAGVGRTTLAMARERDLPGWLAAVHPRFRVPHRAEVALAVVVCVLVLTVDLRGAIGFSSFGVLLYYLTANLSAYSQSAEHRRFPRGLQVLGAVGCAVLVVTLPVSAVLVGLLVFVVGGLPALAAAERLSCQACPRASANSRSRIRSPSARSPLCWYSLVTQGRIVGTSRAVSSDSSRST